MSERGAGALSNGTPEQQPGVSPGGPANSTKATRPKLWKIRPRWGCSRLYDAVTQRGLRHPGDPKLDRHVSTAVARRTRRGWRVDKAREGDRVDGVIALAVAVDRALEGVPEVKLVGWI